MERLTLINCLLLFLNTINSCLGTIRTIFVVKKAGKITFLHQESLFNLLTNLVIFLLAFRIILYGKLHINVKIRNNSLIPTGKPMGLYNPW